MKISQIKFENWRCFKGEQSIVFSTDRLKPISTVYGTNGSGKTTILNSVLWSLWGILTDDFLLPEKLVSEFALDSVGPGKNASCSVEVKFEHAGCKYTVLRTYTETNLGEGRSMPAGSQMKVEEIDSHGESRSWINNDGFDRINEMFPHRLAKYFFFNGESFVSDVTNQTGQKEFGNAVRHVLGLTIYERALQHSNRAIAELDKSIAELDNDEELKALVLKKDVIGQVIETIQLDIERDSLNIEETELDVEKIDEELKKYENINASIEKRISLENGLIEIDKKIKSVRDNLTALIAAENACLFLHKHDQEVIRIGDSHRRQKHIPANFQESFIRDLLESGSCICGEPLNPGDRHHDKVSSRLLEGALTDTEEEWTILVNRLKTVKNVLKKFNTNFRQLVANLEALKFDRNKIETDVSNLNLLIGNFGDDIHNVKELERKRTDKREILRNLYVKKGVDSNELERNKKNFRDIEAGINRIAPKNIQAQMEQKRRQLLLSAALKIEKDLVVRKSELRKRIETSITNIFKQLSATNFFAKLNEDFVLTMYRLSELGEPIEAAMGKGDKQLSYYSFIAALSEFNFSGSETGSLVYESFPIMIDAPFSQLDEDQQKRVIRLLPKLTHQLVVMMLEVQSKAMNGVDTLMMNPKVIVSVLHSINDLIPEKSISLSQIPDPIPYVVRTEGKSHYSKLAQIK